MVMGMRRLVREFLVDENGATAVEYALLVGIIIIGVIGGISSVGGWVGDSYNDTADSYPS